MTTDSEIRERFWAALKKSPFVMLGLDKGGAHSQPMTAQFDGPGEPIWFYTNRDNRLVTGLASGGGAMLQYASKGHDYFACVHGILSIDPDPAIIDHFWSKPIEAWFPQGRQDPSLTMLRFDPDDAELWLADLSIAGTFKMLLGGDMRHEEQGKHAHTRL